MSGVYEDVSLESSSEQELELVWQVGHSAGQVVCDLHGRDGRQEVQDHRVLSEAEQHVERKEQHKVVLEVVHQDALAQLVLCLVSPRLRQWRQHAPCTAG